MTDEGKKLLALLVHLPSFYEILGPGGHGKPPKNLLMIKLEIDKRSARCQFPDEVQKNLSPGAGPLANFDA